MNEELAKEIRKTIESIKDMKTQIGGLNNYLSALEGMVRTDGQKKVDEAYQRGLEDAWEAARKIVLSPDDGGTTLSDLGAIFDGGITYTLKNYSATEAIAKLRRKAYEEKQKADDKINVGDEVVWTEDENVVIAVTSVYTNDSNMEWCDGVCKDGKTYSILTKNARKTGRHFDIDKILEEVSK